MTYLVILTLFVAPLYAWRFNVLGLPLNFLLVWLAGLWLVFVIWLIATKHGSQFITYLKNVSSKLWILIGLFFLAGVISLIQGGLATSTIGQFLVLFVQPMGTFFIVAFTVNQDEEVRIKFRRAVYLLAFAVGILAIAQYFTLVTLPEAWWGNSVEPKRAIGFFSHPDMFGLFFTPILAWLFPDLLRRLDNWKQPTSYLYILAWALGGIGLLLSLSRGAWFGLAAAAFVGIVLYGKKKYWLMASIAALIVAVVIVATPNLRYRFILPFKGEKSAVARLSLWQTGTKMIKDNPLLGKGLEGFNHNWYQYNADPGLDHYNLPHNVLLSFWVDTGLLGVISFAGLCIYGLWYALRRRHDTFALGLGLFLIALIIHGLIDNPYLKNDLALVFWLIWGISLGKLKEMAYLKEI